MLEAGNVFEILDESIKYKMKKLERKVERVNKKLSTLEKKRLGNSVVSPPVPNYYHIQELGGIDVAALLS